MKGKIRVCWYCEKWQPGGIQAVQVNLLSHMDLSNIRMDVVVSEDDTSLFDEKLNAFGVRKIVTLNERYSSPARRVFANIFAFGSLIRKEKYDVVHLNVCHGVELIYCFLAWLYRVPVRIVHCRNNDIGAGGRSRKIKLFCHEICKRVFHGCATIKLANSDLAASWLYTKSDLRRRQVRIIRNGIDSRRYEFRPEIREKIRHELGVEKNFVVGHIGHFNYQKNHEFLLKIFQEILVRCPGAVLLLVGEGEKKGEIEALTQKYKISNHVIFYGVTNDVPAVMMAMDVFVFPSRFEGFGNVLVEAQACGLRCFASRGVIPEAVRITDNLTWIGLDESYSVWAEKILSTGLWYERKNYVKAVINSGYDIADMAKTLESIYCTNR